jgi:ribosomal protein S20
MPNTSSAKKALRSSIKKQEFNSLKKNKLKRSLKDFRKALSTNLENSQKALATVFSSFDKAAKTNTINHKTASRKKSRLTILMKKTFNDLEGEVAQNAPIVKEKIKKAIKKRVVKKAK